MAHIGARYFGRGQGFNDALVIKYSGMSLEEFEQLEESQKQRILGALYVKMNCGRAIRDLLKLVERVGPPSGRMYCPNNHESDEFKIGLREGHVIVNRGLPLSCLCSSDTFWP